MPSLSPTMTEGTIVKWLKNEGDSFSPGEVLCEIQTDKAVVGFEVEEEGILAKILVPEDTKDIKLGTVIALMVEEGEDWKNVEIPATVTPGPPAEERTYETKPSKHDSAGDGLPLEVATTTHGHLMGPAVKLLVEKYRIDATKISPSGPHETILKGDVLKYIEKHGLSQPSEVDSPRSEAVIPGVPPSFVAEQSYVDIPNTSMRKTIAKRLTESKSTIPHAYMKVECQIDELLELRKRFKSEGMTTSVNDFIIKCAAGALQQVPEVNVTFSNNAAHRMLDVDISIAVATEAGLITPIIRGAENLGVHQISETVKELASRAREGKLQPNEFQGGSFCISNLGMFGITEFSAVINPPQGAILAVGTVQTIVGEEGKPESRMTATLSYDARAIDEDMAGRFLKTFKQYMEEPHLMLVLAPTQNMIANSF